MARYVVFNGLTLIHPGGISRTNIDALAQVGPGATGILGLIGEADGGQPNTAVVMDDPSLAKSIFRSGALADAIRVAFEPSGDPRIAGGASRVIAVKPNQSTQATVTLEGQVVLGTDGENQLVLTSVDYGLHTNQIQMSFEEDPVDSTKYTIGISDASITENITDIGGKALMNLVWRGPSEEILVTGAWGAATGDAGDSVTIPDTAVTASVTADMFVRVVTTTDSLAPLGEYRRITTVTPSTSLTVASGTTAAGFSADIDTGDTYEVCQLRVMTIPLTNVTNVTNATITLDPSVYLDDATTGPAFLANKFIRVLDGEGVGQIRKITGATGGDAAALVLTLDGTFDIAPEVGDQVAILDVLTASATITGTGGGATALATTVDYGTSVDALGAQADLSITLSSGKTIDDLVAEINATFSASGQPTAGADYIATVGAGRSGELTSNLFDFDNNNAGIDLLADVNESPNTKTRLLDDLNQVITAINDFSSLITAARATTSGTLTLAGAGIPQYFTDSAPLSGAVRGSSTNANWQSAFDTLLTQRVNTVVPLISDDLTNEGYGSTATVASVRAQLVSHISTANGAGRSERNGYASMKDTSASALTNILNVAASLNSPSVSLVFQSPTLLNVNGSLVEFEPWGMAVLAAGMQAGSSIGEPLTYKYIKTTNVNDNSTSIDVLDRTTANQLLLGGVLFSETISGKGTRWVRGLTTWLADDNLANTDINVREVLDYIAYEWRTQVEDRFTGTKATPTTVAGIKSFSENLFESFRSDGIIVDSTDVATGQTVRAYSAPVVTVSGDIAALQINVYPVMGINFETLETFAQLPVLTAA